MKNLPDSPLLDGPIALEHLAKDVAALRAAAKTHAEENEKLKKELASWKRRAVNAEIREKHLDKAIETLSHDDELWLVRNNLTIEFRQRYDGGGRISIRRRNKTKVAIESYTQEDATGFLKRVIKKARKRRG